MFQNVNATGVLFQNPGASVVVSFMECNQVNFLQFPYLPIDVKTLMPWLFLDVEIMQADKCNES